MKMLYLHDSCLPLCAVLVIIVLPFPEINAIQYDFNCRKIVQIHL